jgi:hypothetical protein
LLKFDNEKPVGVNKAESFVGCALLYPDAVLSDATLCTLPCEHKFHQECVEALRKLGVLQACPLYRAELPDSPKKYLLKQFKSMFWLHER